MIRSLSHAAATALALFSDVGHFLTLCVCSRSALAAENLFLRNQLALYDERKIQPRLATDAVKFFMCALQALRVAERTLRGQAQEVYPLPSERISPVLAVEVQAERPTQLARKLRELIRGMAVDNPILG